MHVAFLLHGAFKGHKNISICPSLDLDIPIKKKGPAYNSDFVIFKTTPQPTSNACDAGGSVGLVVYQSSRPIIVVEVKATVGCDLYKIPPHFVMEMLVYCIYIMKMKNTNVILGCVTDGKAWHAMKLKLMDDGELLINEYMKFASTEDRVIMNSIPGLLTVIG